MTNRLSTRKKAILAIIVVLALAGIVLLACWIIQDKENGSALLAVRTEGYLVDYHDFARDESAAALSLVYVDLSALREMHNNGILPSRDYERYQNLLAHMPSDGVFYPKTYQISSGKYEYDASVNLIDQLIVGVHLAEMNHPPTDLIAFLKGEFRQHQRLAGRYTRESRKPDADYESPAVYGLAIILALQTNDLPWAQQLHERMLQFRDQDPAYPGGYVFDGNTHAFDNLFPLLAETLFEQSK
ncbi:hypothetical protein SAMN04488688_103153 [Paenibacillus sp. cl141a]|uniref:hypothetical protein n=1 Tax=Paenibacillus sp. cl141a TaxID=1761877 RepID=UPI0008B2CEE7|nr:hypothetical protein [Paenibacillus sp. cl141a]SEL21055.1 hypothetical protein SAMN04488688_103153 [Paenibacillus sp. cl141a]